MVTTISLLIVLSAVSVNLIQDVAGLMCFECNSLYDPECAGLTKNDKFHRLYQLCTANYAPDDNVTEYRRPLCRKVYQKIRPRGNLQLIQRSCGHILYKNQEEDVCYDVRDEDHEEIVCQCFEDGCNSAWSTLENVSPIYVFLGVTLSSSFMLNFG